MASPARTSTARSAGLRTWTKLPGSTRPVLQPLYRFLRDHGRGKLTALHVVQRGSKFRRIDSVRSSSRWFSGWPPMSATWSSAAARLAFRDRRPRFPTRDHPLGATTVPQFPDPVAGFLAMRRQHLRRPLRHLDVGRDAQEHRSLGLARFERLGWSAPCQRQRAGRQISGFDVAAPCSGRCVSPLRGLPAPKATTWRPWTLRMSIRGPTPLGPED
jgi:hypothetical protein